LLSHEQPHEFSLLFNKQDREIRAAVEQACRASSLESRNHYLGCHTVFTGSPLPTPDLLSSLLVVPGRHSSSGWHFLGQFNTKFICRISCVITKRSCVAWFWLMNACFLSGHKNWLVS